jgi:hypothetical protein
MSSVILTGDTSGTLTVSAPLVAGSNTLTLPAATGTISLLTQGTAVASTSGTSIDFTGIPSWAKRITVMLNGISTNGSSQLQIQVGSGSFSTSGYSSQAWSASGGGVITSGLILTNAMGAAYIWQGCFVLNLVSSNTWVGTGMLSYTAGTSNGVSTGGATPNLSGALDRIRITTVNGTDTFDAGSINIMYEG